MKIERLAVGDFIKMDEVPSSVADPSCPPEPEMKRVKYQDDHREVYEAVGYVWPPSQEDLSGIRCEGLFVREVESASFLSRHFPMSDDFKNEEMKKLDDGV